MSSAPSSPACPARRVEILAGLRHRLGAAAIIIAVIASSFYGFEAVYFRSAVANATTQPGGWPGAFAIVAVSAFVHELLHALGWIIGAKLPLHALSVRRTLRAMGFIACTNVPLPLSVFRFSLLLPAVILGGGTITLGLATGRGLFLLWGHFFLLECYSDLTVLLAIARLRAPVQVRDFPDRLGCAVEFE